MKEGFWKKIGMLAGCVAFSAFAASAPEGNLAVVGVEKVTEAELAEIREAKQILQNSVDTLMRR